MPRAKNLSSTCRILESNFFHGFDNRTKTLCYGRYGSSSQRGRGESGFWFENSQLIFGKLSTR